MTYKQLCDKIPLMACKAGCSDCCGLVLFSKSEWKRIQGERQKQAAIEDCEYLHGNHCSIYEQRPFLCRLFGAVSEPGDMMSCPHGCRPENPLTPEEAQALMSQYLAMFHGQDIYCTIRDTSMNVGYNGANVAKYTLG
jgi:hypothetical protein